jgi:cell wall assembly regulator SMI1
MPYNWRENVQSELNRPSDEDLARVERELKKKLPRELRAFIAEHNQSSFGAPRFRRMRKPGEDDEDTIYTHEKCQRADKREGT